MAKLLSRDEVLEVEETVNKIIMYVELYTTGTVYYDEWYAGITGQEQIDKIKEQLITEGVTPAEMLNEIAKRINGHKANFPNMDEDSWHEWTTSSTGVALEVERKLHQLGFDGEGTDGRPGNLSLNPTIVYVFIHGK